MKINSLQNNIGFGTAFCVTESNILYHKATGRLTPRAEEALLKAKEAVKKMGGEDKIDVGFAVTDHMKFKAAVQPKIKYYTEKDYSRSRYSSNDAPIIHSESPVDEFANFCTNLIKQIREGIKLTKKLNEP